MHQSNSFQQLSIALSLKHPKKFNSKQLFSKIVKGTADRWVKHRVVPHCEQLHNSIVAPFFVLCSIFAEAQIWIFANCHRS